LLSADCYRPTKKGDVSFCGTIFFDEFCAIVPRKFTAKIKTQGRSDLNLHEVQRFLFLGLNQLV
jgi:hypothetical protein